MEAAKKLQSYFISLQREDQPTAEEMLRKVCFASCSYG
jgi:mediator of RNA polymerase II transcription subunit 28